jgi:hypothetical protein
LKSPNFAVNDRRFGFEKNGVTVCARHKVKDEEVKIDKNDREKNKNQEEAGGKEGGCLFLNGVMSPYPRSR